MSSYIGTAAITRGRRGRLPGDRVRCGRPGREGPAHRPVDRRTDRARRKPVLARAHRHRGRAFGNHLRLRGGRGAGVFSLTAPRFAIAQLAKNSSEGLALSGQTLYSLNSSAR